MAQDAGIGYPTGPKGKPGNRETGAAVESSAHLSLKHAGAINMFKIVFQNYQSGEWHVRHFDDVQSAFEWMDEVATEGALYQDFGHEGGMPITEPLYWLEEQQRYEQESQQRR